MTKAVLEAESEGDARHTTAGVASPALAVPPACTPRCWRGLIGSARPRTWRRSGRQSDGSSTRPAGCGRAQAGGGIGFGLDRLIVAGFLFRQGVPPHATYLFKHALVQNAPYGTLLREPRRALHARIADTLENQFSEIAERRPELLARQCTEAGLVEACGALGQSRTKITGALRADRSGHAVYARSRASRVLACNAHSASRTDQAAGWACECLVSYQRDGGARDKSGVRLSSRYDRASGKIRRACRRPAIALLRPLRLVHSEVYELRRRCCVRSCAAVPCTC